MGDAQRTLAHLDDARRITCAEHVSKIRSDQQGGLGSEVWGSRVLSATADDAHPPSLRTPSEDIV